MRRSVRLTATLIVTVTVAVALGVTAAVLVQILRGSLEATASQDAERRLQAAARLIVEGGQARPLPQSGAGAATGLAAPLPQGGRPDPDILVTNDPPPGWTAGYAAVSGAVQVPGGAVLFLQSRASLGPVAAALDALRPLLLIGVPALLALVGGVTWVLVGRVMAPVSAIRATFTEITASGLDRRVPVPTSRDEVARLAVAMNATLDRLERAVGQHRRFVADAAHELRSPLATLRTRLELGGRRAEAAADRAVVEEALVDVGRIQALAADLLLLSRLDAGEPLRCEPVDLGQVAAEAAAEADLRSSRDDVRVLLDIATDVVVPGSPGHLARLVGNLADNALRHAASRVVVRVLPPGTLEVQDDGPGIPPPDRERVFDRFTRLDEARVRDGAGTAGGCGLGLAIARDIARAHGGTLVVATPRSGPVVGTCLRAVLSGG